MIAQQPKVSVIIPNYNHGRYLPKRIESVLNQTFADFEVFILDDCSQDESQQIIARYAAADSRITALANSQNSGSVFKQWNLGLRQARGEYIWIAESDDFAEPLFLATLVSLLEQDSTIAFAYTNSWIVDEQAEVHGTTADWKRQYFADGHWSKDYTVAGEYELQHYLSVACTVNNASSVLFRRASIDAAGGIDTDFRYTGDWLMYSKLSLVGRVAYVDKCLSNYREHSANASKKSEADGSQLFERLKCFAYIYQSGKLPADARQRLVAQASQEYHKLQYKLLRDNKDIKLLFSYIKGIAQMSSTFYLRLQTNSIKFFLKK